MAALHSGRRKLLTPGERILPKLDVYIVFRSSAAVEMSSTFWPRYIWNERNRETVDFLVSSPLFATLIFFLFIYCDQVIIQTNEGSLPGFF